MAEDALRIGGLSSGMGGFSSGLAVILAGEDRKEKTQKTHFVSNCEDIGQQPVERTLEHIFGLPHKSINLLTNPVDNHFLHFILKNEFVKFQDMNCVYSNRDGICILNSGGQGLHTVVINEASICGDVKIFKQPLIVESLAMFSSARANDCVWKGKWMYEVILETSGVQQLGWATFSCPFTDHKGVGDAEDSYSFDGRRVTKWNKDAETYGQSWVVGDVIGCCIDLEHDEISFYRNGVSFGVAFEGIRKMEPGLGYYPAVSLSQGERCDLNFGSRPFKYPIEDIFFGMCAKVVCDYLGLGVKSGLPYMWKNESGNAIKSLKKEWEGVKLIEEVVPFFQSLRLSRSTVTTEDCMLEIAIMVKEQLGSSDYVFARVTDAMVEWINLWKVIALKSSISAAERTNPFRITVKRIILCQVKNIDRRD